MHFENLLNASDSTKKLEIALAEVYARLHQLHAQRNFLNTTIQEVTEQANALRLECARMQHTNTGTTSPPHGEEMAVLEHLRLMQADAPHRAVNCFGATTPVHLARGRTLNSQQARRLLGRLIAQGKVRRTGHTRAAKYYLAR